MLWLKRYPGETIVLDGRITLHVDSPGKGWVKIGIDAPREVDVKRGELLAEATVPIGSPEADPPTAA